MERLRNLSSHVLVSDSSASSTVQPTPSSSGHSAAQLSSGTERLDDDVVICCALRTPVGRAGRGNLKDTPCEELLRTVFQAVLERTKVAPESIDDVQIGNALQPGAGGFTSRMAQFLAGMPIEVPICTINRQCSSGLQAVASVAASIRAGIIDIGLAGGVESMSMYNMASSMDLNKLSPQILCSDLASACLTPMGITSENVAREHHISREAQDRMAVESHAKAVAAQKEGKFDEELVPVITAVKDKAGKETQVTVKVDEGPRPGTTLAGLSKLKPSFKPGGTTTAGNSSQVSDGAALVLLARRSSATSAGLPILAKLRSFAAVGVDPKVMGVGPAFAIPVALKKAGVEIGDIDIFEINEAFASQAAFCVEHLKIPMEKVNPKGGAIALGHPLGCTGARQVATLLPELRRTGKRLGVVSMCVGTGMGAAAVIESEQ